MRPDQKSPSVYVFDAPITEAKTDPVTVKILVCDTQGLGQNNIETLINSIKAQKNAPIVYIFSEVNPATLASINTCFNDNSHYIFEQAYPKSGNKSDNTKLVTLFNKSAMRRNAPQEMKIDCDGQLVQSFLCMLANSVDDIVGSYSFVLHAAHLNLGNKYSISDVEETILTKIFDRPNKNKSKKYPQILAGDLGIPTLAGDSLSNSIAALTHVPSSSSMVIDDMEDSIGYYNVHVTPFQWIDLVTAQPYPKSKDERAEEMQDISQLTLLSKFGGKYLEVCHGLSKKNYPNEIYVADLQAAINNHLKRSLQLSMSSDSIDVRLACMPGDNPLRHYLVLRIPENLWSKLGVFTFKEGKVAQKDQGDYLLSWDFDKHDKLIASFKSAVEALAKYNFFELEDKIPGLRVHLFKHQEHEICLKFEVESAKGQSNLLATQIAAATNVYNIHDDATKDLIENLMSAVWQISAVNEKFSGLVTASFLYQKAQGTPYFMKLEFFNSAIARFVRSSGHLDMFGGSYSIKPLDQQSYYNAGFLQEDGSLILPINVTSGKSKTHDPRNHLSCVLLKRANEISGYLPLVIYDVKGQAFGVRNPLPYALVQRFSLGKPTKVDKLFSYPSEKGSTDILGGLFQDRFNLEAALVRTFQSYTGTDKAYRELAAVSKAKGNDVVAACQDMVEHCCEKIKLAEEASKNAGFFSNVPKIDNRTDLLHKSIANVNANFQFNCKAEGNIQTLQQLINTQEKRVLVELCEKERKSADGEPYNKFRKNSALLLLEHHLILSHPAHTAKDVWEYIKDEPVGYYGTGKNYMDEPGGRELKLKKFLHPLSSVMMFIASLATSNEAVMDQKNAFEKVM